MPTEALSWVEESAIVFLPLQRFSELHISRDAHYKQLLPNYDTKTEP